MDVLEAIRTRRSIRSFKPDPVPRKILEELLDTCRWAPSSLNTQPWQFVILGGKALEEVKALNKMMVLGELGAPGSTQKQANPDLADYGPMSEPYLRRWLASRFHVDSQLDLLEWPEAPEATKVKVETQVKNACFGHAPNAILICAEEALGSKAIFGAGLMVQTIALAALAYGLGTGIAIRPVRFPQMLRGQLGIPESMLILVSMAIGYPDFDDPVNNTPRHREPLDVLAHWHGF